MSDPNGASFIDIPQVFNDPNYAKSKLKYVKDRTVIDFWNKEMAQTSDYHKSEVLGWFVSKFGAFLSNEMMRNVIGQTKSGFNLRDIMDNKKILLVNLSKGKTGELNSQLLGMIFVMKFQAAAMSRANIPEDQRQDFSLYVDEFQNFATESFESILSEARKYRLNLILANQFMTQLTDKIREAIIGNVGTVISGRIGTTDAEMMAKKFSPTFNAEDLTRLPNFEAVTSIMINNVPSSPFSMSLIPPLGQPNPQLADALKKLSSAKYGTPRSIVDQEIFRRLSTDESEKTTSSATLNVATDKMVKDDAKGSFLDDWLAKRKQATRQQIAVENTSFASKNQAVPIVNTSVQPAMTRAADNRQNSASTGAGYKPKEDNRLYELQKKGIGNNVAFGYKERSKVITPEDHIALEEALETTKTSDVMRRDAERENDKLNNGELKLSRKNPSPDSFSVSSSTTPELDEIYIDIRGKLYHGKDEQIQH